MLFELLFLVVAVQFFLPTVSAQVVFSSPTQGQVISGDVPFILSVSESTSAPFFSQMTNFSLFLMAGSYASPTILFTWDISSTNPSTIDNSVIIPSAAGTNAQNAYFFGIRGSVILASTLSIAYFSPFFTLQNMTGASSLIGPGVTRTLTAATGTQTAVATLSPLARAIICKDPVTGQDITAALGDPTINNPCVRSASSVLSVLATSINTATAISRIGTTTISTGAGVASSTSTPVGSAAVSTKPTETPSNVSGRYIYIAIIVTITFLAPIICLWLFLRHRRARTLAASNPSTPTREKEEPSSPFDVFRPIVSSLKGFAVLSKGNDERQQQPTKFKRKNSDAEEGQHGLEVHVTRSLRYFSTRDSHFQSPTSRTPRTPRTPKTPKTPNTPKTPAAPIITERRILPNRALEAPKPEPDTRRSSRRTILAELEGDYIIPPPMPDMPDMPGTATEQTRTAKNDRSSVASEIGRWRTDSDQAFESLDAQQRSEALSQLRDKNRDSLSAKTEGGDSCRYSTATSARRTVILSEGQEVRVVKGKDVANIVTFVKKHSNKKEQQHPPMPVRIPIPQFTVIQDGGDKSLPTRPHVAHLSLMPSTTPRLPISRFSLRGLTAGSTIARTSTSMSTNTSNIPISVSASQIPSSPAPPPKTKPKTKTLLPSSPLPPGRPPLERQRSRSRISTLDAENNFSEGQACVVVEGEEEEKRRRERRERKREELSNGATGAGKGPVGSPTFGGKDEGKP